ncbi:MAG TPA: glutamyl-tRNA reductase [Planctomycetaceae bacterium]|nr:glutamyl-tRNA reductase [Planctomycetaceae bacterium]
MNLGMIGCNLSAPLEIREKLAFSPLQIADALVDWDAAFPGIEAVLLSTCNRTELYVASDECVENPRGAGEEFRNTVPALPTRGQLVDFLLNERRTAGSERPETETHLSYLQGREAVAHLFTVASSLDSMVLGEVQILAQVKAAYQAALDAGTVGPMTHGVFQAALRVAKRVANETRIQQHRISIPSVAVSEFVLRLFETLTERTTLVLGAGEMAEETIRYLKLHGAGTVYLANRSRPKAEELAETWNGRVVDWKERLDWLSKVDLAIGTTGAQHPVITDAQFGEIASRRAGRPLFLLDLAVPRDFEPEIGNRGDVYLYSLEDLKEACEENRRRRAHEMPKALRIVEQESESFLRDIHHRRTGELIQRLQNKWETTKQAELARLLNKLGPHGLDARGIEEVRYAFDRLVNKLIHPPLESLRDESRNGVPHGLLDALGRLFRLK